MNSTYDLIRVESDNGVFWLTLNRPEKLNATNDALLAEMEHAMAEFDADDSLHVAILRGAGRAFCSGADVHQRQLRPPDELKRLGGPSSTGSRADFFADSVNFKPIVAAVHGYAIGRGLSLTMHSDVVVAAEGTLFQNRETHRGLGGTHNWALIANFSGDRFANEVSLTGRMFSAEEAMDHGLINFVVPMSQLHDKAEEVARQIIANPPLSVRATVRPSRWYMQRFEQEVQFYAKGLGLHLTEDFRESAMAFAEKRAPQFKGQ